MKNLKNLYAGESIQHSPLSKEKRPDVSIWFDVDEKKKERACNFIRFLSKRQCGQRMKKKNYEQRAHEHPFLTFGVRLHIFM